MTMPNFNKAPDMEVASILMEMLPEMSNEQLKMVERKIKKIRSERIASTQWKDKNEVAKFIEYVCDELGIRTLNKTKTDTRSANYWRCMIHYLFTQKNMHEREIADLLKRDRSLICNQLRRYHQLQNMYSDDAILFRKQRKIFEDTIRKYHNGTEKYKMAMAV